MRKIPSVMFSQHPDNASSPYWHSKPYIETHHELFECYLMFKELGAQEYMWDWEGKLVDESVIERLLQEYPDFFEKKPIGKELFITFRIPNPAVETGFRLARAFMVILSARQLALSHDLHAPPLFEVILPLAEKAEDMIYIQKSFQRLARAVHIIFKGTNLPFDSIEVIPTFEDVQTLMNSGKILKKYIEFTQKNFHSLPIYLRPFCARSDPALNSGIIPTTLAIKWALSEYAKFTQDTGILTYPIIAPGALPFRGGLTPETVDEFMQEFQGIKTVVIQSSFRYDFPVQKVRSAIQKITRELPRSESVILSDKTGNDIHSIIPWFETPYKDMVMQIAPFVNNLSHYIPKRRERFQHIGLFGYSREVSGTKLPRAIGFTACCYSLGIPPELLGMGKGLKKAIKEHKIKLIESLYKGLKPMLLKAGRYLRKESINELGLKDLEKEIKIIEDYVGESLGPRTKTEIEHGQLVAQIVSYMKNGKNPQSAIKQAA
ncbi:MAG: phosphoenolpyruvate carboxylase, partial [Patescibacteria group bacterium]